MSCTEAETLDFLDNTVHKYPLEEVVPLRQAYEREVYNIKEVVVKMRVDGKGWEEIANVVSPLRRKIGMEYKDLTPPELLEVYHARNLREYGDKLGPSAKQFYDEGYSWKQVSEKACRPDGGKLRESFKKKME